MLRYDTSGTDWWVTDIIFLNASKFIGDNAPTMPALVLEGARVEVPALYNIFLVDLALGDNDDISDCWSIGYNCSDSQPIEKYDVFNFSCKLPGGVETLFNTINFEAMAYYDDPNNDDECFNTLILVNDNGGFDYNYWVTYEIDYCDSNIDKSCWTNATTTTIPTTTTMESETTSDSGKSDDSDPAAMLQSNRITVMNALIAAIVICVLNY